ncbi:MAG TPA: type IV toxin-antitoxin system AbiEi family antitoxin domain-containing protein [Bryobacteraceae bacterium]|nr:type IV toxin-antitoxin system AbiEi family antitoxin domain-containing protein [Bryobacteraceae bacterium]
MPTASERILEIAKRQRIVRPRDLAACGIARQHLIRLLRRGALTRTARGIYTLTGAAVTEHHGLALAAKQAPGAVVCLLSALQFHGLTTQQPHEVWIAVAVKARKPAITWPAVRIVRFSGAALTEGVESHPIEGVRVRVYGIAKTVADCFKYRRKIGTDVAIEALRDALRKRVSVDAIYRFAKICRVANVIRPYLESVV